MKFKLSTLMWFVTLANVIVGAVLWVQNERATTAKILAEADAEKAAFQKGVNEIVAKVHAEAHYYKRGMGEIDNVND